MENEFAQNRNLFAEAAMTEATLKMLQETDVEEINTDVEYWLTASTYVYLLQNPYSKQMMLISKSAYTV